MSREVGMAFQKAAVEYAEAAIGHAISSDVHRAMKRHQEASSESNRSYDLWKLSREMQAKAAQAFLDAETKP